MKFRLFVEGETEDLAIGQFLAKWLNEQGLKQPVGISPRRFQGCNRLWQDTPKAAITELTDPGEKGLIGVVSLVDLASDLPFPEHMKSGKEKADWQAASRRARQQRKVQALLYPLRSRSVAA